MALGAVTVEVIQFCWWKEERISVGGMLLPMEDLLHFSQGILSVFRSRSGDDVMISDCKL